MTKKSFKYDESIEELNGILEDLEAERISVDEVSGKVKRATELIRACKEIIQKTEIEVKKIVKEFEKSEENG
jgi:exodeoxyribonuclease VII small subunit